jgi:hypothetical protein
VIVEELIILMEPTKGCKFRMLLQTPFEDFFTKIPN